MAVSIHRPNAQKLPRHALSHRILTEPHEADTTAGGFTDEKPEILKEVK